MQSRQDRFFNLRKSLNKLRYVSVTWFCRTLWLYAMISLLLNSGKGNRAMQRKQILTALSFAVGAGFGSASEAALYDRGNGLVYDDVLNVTWAQDGNLFKTLAKNTPNLVNNIIANAGGLPDSADGLHQSLTSRDFNAYSGYMSWLGAKVWTDNLIYGGYDDWRLPKFTGDTTCAGYNCKDSELSYMFYINLGVRAGQSVLSGSNAENLALFTNLQNYYWTGVEFSLGPGNVWTFQYGGYQQPFGSGLGYGLYAWAIRDGDVATVPAPTTSWLFISGFIGVFGFAKRARQKS